MKKYDVVIVGSGLGALLCAYALGKEGRSVLILERNQQIGGSLQTFVRDKIIFDTGIHYIGGLDEGQNLNRYFKYFGLMKELKLKKMDIHGFDRISFHGDPQEYHYDQGYDNFIETLSGYFPDERPGIVRYTDKLKQICASFPLYNLGDDGLTGVAFEYLSINARDFIAECVSNPRLRSVLGGTNPLYAGSGEKTPLYVHALINNTYIESSWRCVNGGSQISKILAKSIRSFGGEILRYKTAKKFVFEGSELTAVEMIDGERFYGKSFISNIHPVQTLRMLEDGTVRPAYRNRINALENTVSVFTVHIVFKKDTFPYPNYNHYHYHYDKVWEAMAYSEATWPEGYSMFFGLSSKMDDFAENVNIMTYMHYEEVKPWAATYNTVAEKENRSESYKEFKRMKAEKIIDRVELKFPGFRNCIHAYYTSTPLTVRDYIGSDDGTLYGIAKDFRDPLRSFISPKTKIPNLFLTGQNLNMHGVLGVTISAVQTAAEYLGMENLLKDIKASS